MRLEDLERNLNLGNQFGFKKETDSPDFRGWILVDKQQPNDRYLSLLEPGEEPELIAEEESIRRKPYRVRVIELRSVVHESDHYETADDYRLNERYHFSTLEDVETFIQQKFGQMLQNIRWLSDLEAP